MTKKRIIKIFFIATFIAIAFFINGLNNFIDSIPQSKTSNSGNTEAIIILTGGSGRLTEGLKLLTKNKDQKLFVSGVGKETNLASLLIMSGPLPENIAELTDQIELGYEAKDTKGNAIETANWVKENDFKNITLVTANYHIPRSMLELSTMMPNVKIVPYPVFSDLVKLEKWWQRYGTRKLLTTEYLKYLTSKYIS